MYVLGAEAAEWWEGACCDCLQHLCCTQAMEAVCIPNHAVQYPRSYPPVHVPSYEQMYGAKGFAASSSLCTIIFALHPQVLNEVLQHHPILKKAVEEELHNLSFPVFQAMYFAYMAEQRPDIQEIYRAISKPSFEAVMPGEAGVYPRLDIGGPALSTSEADTQPASRAKQALR